MGNEVEYYTAVAGRMVPFLRGRKVVVEQRFRGSDKLIYRRHQGTGASREWIAIRDAEDVVHWARQHVVAFHAHLKAEGPGAWFFLDIDSRALPTEMARVGALHALALIEEQGLSAMVKFSGSDGFHLMWEMPDLAGLGRRDLWDFERAIVQALADWVEGRLAHDPRADPIRAAVGTGAPLVATSSQDDAHRAALLFDMHILKPNVNARVPYSLHPATGLVAVPLDRSGLERFDEQMGDPATVAARPGEVAMPRNALADVSRALAVWTGDG